MMPYSDLIIHRCLCRGSRYLPGLITYRPITIDFFKY